MRTVVVFLLSTVTNNINIDVSYVFIGADAGLRYYYAAITIY